MSHNPKRRHKRAESNPDGYAAESPFPR